MTKSTDYDLDSLIGELRDCEAQVLRGFVEAGQWTDEMRLIEAKGFEIQEIIRDNFPDLDSHLYRFTVHSPQ
jgi:hypothetical protein